MPPRATYLMPQEIRQWREEMEVSQIEAATLLGFSLRQYCNFELGTSPIPKSVKIACMFFITLQGLSYPQLQEKLEDCFEVAFSKEE
jgi:DNA-binding transcriptional regulator YiaG